VHVRRKLEVLVADETSADLLDTKVGAPLFYFHTQGYTRDEQPIEYSIAKYRGDLNYFRLDIDQKTPWTIFKTFFWAKLTLF